MATVASASEKGTDSAAAEVEAADHLWTVLGQSSGFVPSNSKGNPEPYESPAANHMRGGT